MLGGFTPLQLTFNVPPATTVELLALMAGVTGVGLGVGVMVGVTVGAAVGVADGLGAAVGDGLAVGVTVGLGLGELPIVLTSHPLQ